MIRDVRLDPALQQTVPTIGSKGFDTGSINLFRSLLERFRWGKDLNFLLDPAINFHVVYDPTSKRITLRNYFNGETGVGTCGELAEGYAKELLKYTEIQTKYDVVVIGGSDMEFSEGHAFLLVAPKELNMINALKEQLGIFPEGSILIDPTHGVLEIASKFNGQSGTYKIDSRIPYVKAEDCCKDTDVGLPPLEKKKPEYLVLGYLSDYIPEICSVNDNRTLYLGFEIDSLGDKIPTVGLFTQEPRSNIIPASELESVLNNTPSAQNANLNKLLQKIRSDLAAFRL